MGGARVPVILDTDIGHDIDDTWALALLLKSPEVDLKLAVSATHDTVYSASLLAKLLTVAGRTDVAVGIGLRQDDVTGGQLLWVQDYDLASYQGSVQEDGVGAMIDAIMTSPERVTLVGIGPAPNLAAALEREPRIAERARFVGMYGSVRRGYGGAPPSDAEYNVAAFPQACRKVFTAAWDVTITPLDTCARVVLTGEKYRRVRDSQDPLTRAVIENYRTWCSFGERDRAQWETRSTPLFDTVAAYLTFSEELLVMEELGLRVTDDGYTVVDERAKRIRCAMEWKDLGAFEDLLVERLTNG